MSGRKQDGGPIQRKGPPPPPPWHRDLFTVGVTGTNGKTTTTAYVAAALRELGRPVPRVTTLGSYLDDEKQQLPEGYRGFLEIMKRARDRGATHAAIELTSEALALGFARAWPSRVGVFTNLTRDHFDTHGGAEHYLASKAQLFVHLVPGGSAVLNACDAAGALLAQIVPQSMRMRTFAVPSRGATWTEPDVRAVDVGIDPSGTRVRLAWKERPSGAPDELSVRAIGEVFAENALAALLAAIEAGVDAAAAARALATCPSPAGRFELVSSRGPFVVVDYAHSPDALTRVIATGRRLVSQAAGSGRVVVLFGAGGNRDQGKRAQMGAAVDAADRVVLTSDNPRNEDPALIAAAIREGIPTGPEVCVELDRRAAIERAIREAAPEDVVIIAGKGHEQGQRVGEELRPFSDVDEVRRVTGAQG